MDFDELKERETELKKEIQDYEREKDHLKQMLGNIGGKTFSKMDMVINIVFLVVILLIFILEITTHFLPTFISLEVSVLLVSIKIVWMIHSQHKVNHFQFWVLSSIEFRVNEMAKRNRKIEKSVKEILDKID